MPDIKKDNPNIEKGQPNPNLDVEKDKNKSGMGQNREDQDVEDLGKKHGQPGPDNFGKQGSSEDKGYTK